MFWRIRKFLTRFRKATFGSVPTTGCGFIGAGRLGRKGNRRCTEVLAKGDFKIGRVLHLKSEIRNIKFRHPDLVRLFVANEEIRMSQRSPLLSRGGVAAPSRKCREASF